MLPIEGAGFSQLGSRLDDFAKFAGAYFQMEVNPCLFWSYRVDIYFAPSTNRSRGWFVFELSEISLPYQKSQERVWPQATLCIGYFECSH